MSLTEYLSNLFSSSSKTPDDVIQEALEENEKKQDEKKSKHDDELVTDLSISKDEWKYDFEPHESVTLAGDEVRTDAPDGTAYAGAFVREMVESHREQEESYTRFGYTKHPVRGIESVGIPHKELFKHIALFGVTGYGKSTVMKNMMIQWIFAGYGLCFIDPTGDDSMSLLRMIPEYRTDDIIWVQPGNRERDKAVAFNFFDTHSSPGDSQHETEVEEIRSDFVSILKEGLSGWGAIIESVSRAISKQLIQAEENYNPVDMYKILNNEDEREAFAEMYGNEIEQQYLKRISQMEQDELESLNRRLREWAETDTTREIIGHEKSKINLSDVVKEGKILIANTSSLGDEKVEKLVTTAIIRRLWATIRARADIPKEERDPFFLCIDEFDKVANEENNIEDILSKGRKLRICTFVANQQPNQLPDSIRDAVYSNCANLFSFNPGAANYKDAKTLSKTLGGVEAHQLMSLGSYNLLGRVTINDSKTDALDINTFPEYPPIRSEEEAEELIEQSIEKYGVDREVSTDFSDYGVLRFTRGEGSEDSVSVGNNESISKQQILESVYSARYKYDTSEYNNRGDWIKDEHLKQELEKYVDDLGYDTAIDNITEGISEELLERVLDGSVYFRVTNKGLDEIFGEQDSGDSASGGKISHRELLKAGHRVFSALGYDTTVPQQKGDAAPDGIANPPINPVEESESMEEAEQLRNELQEMHPRLWDLFKDSKLHLEAESTTIEKPKQTIKNLTKALEKGNHCVFIVKDGRSDDNKNHDFEHWARAGENIFEDPPFVSQMDEDGHRKFYNMNSVINLDDGKSKALMKNSKEGGKQENTIWHEYGKHRDDITTQIVLKNSSQEVIATFDDPSNLRQPSTTDFEYHYYRDRSKGKTVVEDKQGNIVDEYETVKEMEKSGYTKVKRPLIPEEYLPGGTLPDRDNWTFVIIPKPDSDMGPHIYDNGDLVPLFTNHSADGNEILSDAIESNGDEEAESTSENNKENGPDSAETENRDEDTTSNRSTQDVENDENDEESEERDNGAADSASSVEQSNNPQDASRQENEQSDQHSTPNDESIDTSEGDNSQSEVDTTQETDDSSTHLSDESQPNDTQELTPSYECVTAEQDRSVTRQEQSEFEEIEVQVNTDEYKSNTYQSGNSTQARKNNSQDNSSNKPDNTPSDTETASHSTSSEEQPELGDDKQRETETDSTDETNENDSTTEATDTDSDDDDSDDDKPKTVGGYFG